MRVSGVVLGILLKINIMMVSAFKITSHFGTLRRFEELSKQTFIELCVVYCITFLDVADFASDQSISYLTF